MLRQTFLLSRCWPYINPHQRPRHSSSSRTSLTFTLTFTYIIMGFFSSSEDETTWQTAHQQVTSAGHKVCRCVVIVIENTLAHLCQPSIAFFTRFHVFLSLLSGHRRPSHQIGRAQPRADRWRRCLRGCQSMGEASGMSTEILTISYNSNISGDPEQEDSEYTHNFRTPQNCD